MNKNLIIGLSIFIAVCIGAIAYVQVDQYTEKKKIEAQAEALRKKMEKETKEILAEEDPIQKSLKAHQQQQQQKQ